MQKMNILLLEDRQADAELIKKYLSDANLDCTISCVDNEQGFIKCLEDNPDLIISDYVLPHFDGLAALNYLKEKKLNIPFILISSLASEDVVHEALKTGANHFIYKDNLKTLSEVISNEIEKIKLLNQMSTPNSN